MPVYLTPEFLRFLRGLVKHNDRSWFEERRAIYERAVKAPFEALVDEINGAMAEFAPEHIRPAHKVVMRIYRDTRFSPDKRPYKRHMAAWWARRGFEKTAAAGYFLQVGPAGILIGAGVYAPERNDLLTLRRWLAEEHARYRKTLAPLLKAKGRQAALEILEPNALKRNPKGFAPDHPAGDLLRARNWGVMVPLQAAEAALADDFSAALGKHFRQMAPLVDLLNEAFVRPGKAAGGERSLLD